MEVRLRTFSEHKTQAAGGPHTPHVRVLTGMTSALGSSRLFLFSLISFSHLSFNELDHFYWVVK